MEWYFYPLTIAAGIACGFINTLAGSGSLISLPLLMLLGLPANVANGTNRVAILLQTMVAVDKFRQDKTFNMRRGLLLALPAIVGGIAGAQIAVNLNEEVMETVIGVLMVIMLVVMFVQPDRWLKGRPEMLDRRPGWLQVVTFFFIGMYGGFIQVGVGIFLLAGLVLAAGYELVGANIIKNLIVMCFTVFALAVFVLNGQVAWLPGLVLALGNMIGAWMGARIALRKGAAFVRWVLVAVIVVSASSLLGLSDLVISLFRM